MYLLNYCNYLIINLEFILVLLRNIFQVLPITFNVKTEYHFENILDFYKKRSFLSQREVFNAHVSEFSQ